MKKAYIAGPLFDDHEREYLEKITEIVEDFGFETFEVRNYTELYMDEVTRELYSLLLPPFASDEYPENEQQLILDDGRNFGIAVEDWGGQYFAIEVIHNSENPFSPFSIYDEVPYDYIVLGYDYEAGLIAHIFDNSGNVKDLFWDFDAEELDYLQDVFGFAINSYSGNDYLYIPENYEYYNYSYYDNPYYYDPYSPADYYDNSVSYTHLTLPTKA